MFATIWAYRRRIGQKIGHFRGQFDRGDIARITGLPDRSARRVLSDVIAAGLLGSETPKGPVSLRFPPDALDVLFPRLFPET